MRHAAHSGSGLGDFFMFAGFDQTAYGSDAHCRPVGERQFGDRKGVFPLDSRKERSLG